MPDTPHPPEQQPPKASAPAALTGPDGSLVLASPVTLPDVLDVLIVGGGPAGTAAAFRAKELNLAALVIEHDDILKRIRDYDRRKPIKPDFGAGKQMAFPAGGPLVATLQFEDIDKDDMCGRWQELYRRHSVPARIGIELQRLTRLDDKWQATVRNHNLSRVETLVVRHVVLALGGGMPRTLDVVGNVAAVSTRMGAPTHFVGACACVIGGGSSAAEAVIAISRAKAAANDINPVYWAHRGDKMPKVSEALAAELFEAVNVHGNVRYLLNSDPVSVVRTQDGRDCLRVEIDRKVLPGRPAESVQLEFDAASSLACIGQELPTHLLETLGVVQMTGGPNNKRAFVLTPLLETSLPDVYLIGDTLNQSYLECRSFGDDPSKFEERLHRGNIKRALTDGVLVTEAIAQKLAGRTAIRVAIEPVAPPPAAAVAKKPDGPSAVLTRLLENSVEAEQFPLHANGATSIGREGCDISFKDDSGMSPRHATIVGSKAGYFVRDAAPSGVFLRLSGDRSYVIEPGAIVRVGTQWLVFGTGADRLTFTHCDPGGAKVAQHRLSEGTVVIGRASPDIVIAKADGHLSRRHVSLTVRGTDIHLRDLKTLNGTYLRVSETMALTDGDEIWIGQQVLRFSLLVDGPKSTIVEYHTTAKGISPIAPPRAAAPAPPPAAAPPPVAKPPKAPAAAPPGSLPAAAPPAAPPAAEAAPPLPAGLAVSFADLKKVCPVRPGQSICEVAEGNGVTMPAECHAGVCGSDPIRVLAGRENLNLMTVDEQSTLREICGLDPTTHRLACVARPAGPVTVSIVKQ